MSAKPLSRRTLLKGLGGVAVGLPFLEEMATFSAAAAENSAVPIRAFNVFFGLGIPRPLQNEGFDGVLEPLRPLSDKLLIMRDVDHVRCDEAGSNAHYDGASAAFTAEPPNGEAKSGGPSIDQIIRQTYHPDGLPPGIVPTLVGGTFFRRSRPSRYVHSYNQDGTMAASMQETPRALFDRVFGIISPTSSSDALEARRKRSVLDAVIEQYKFYTGPNSPLGTVSKRRVANHLDRIREYEHRAYEMDKGGESKYPLPPRSQVAHGGEADPGGMGIDITLEELVTEWRLMADLYALAIQTDSARFGSITFLAAGERIRLTGDYEYEGKKLFQFDDGKQHNATGDKGCSHEWWHQFNMKKENKALRAHAHMKMREVAYFLNRLDDSESLEANGKSILENALITISTESGDGRHNDVKRELTGVFHAVTSANGRFKTGESIDVKAEGLDVYNTMLTAMGAKQKLGPGDREANPVDGIRA